MKIFLDTEFNGFGNELISLALVAEDDRSIYIILPCPNPQPWIRENVLPHLTNCPVKPVYPASKKELASAIAGFINMDPDPTIIADWPDDLRLFFDSLTLGNGMMVGIGNIKTEMFRPNPIIMNQYVNPVPHNAWWDAMHLKTALTNKH